MWILLSYRCAKGNLVKVHQLPFITFLGNKVQNAGLNVFLLERSGYNKLISWKGFHHFGLSPLIVFIFASILVKVYVNVNQFKSADMTYKTHFNLWWSIKSFQSHQKGSFELSGYAGKFQCNAISCKVLFNSKNHKGDVFHSLYISNSTILNNYTVVGRPVHTVI